VTGTSGILKGLTVLSFKRANHDDDDDDDDDDNNNNNNKYAEENIWTYEGRSGGGLQRTA